MLRGVITLDKKEINQVLQFVPQIPNNSLVINKFAAALQDAHDPVGVQVSEEELEVVMDSLPAPSIQAPIELRSLRIKMSEFLAKLRA